MRMKDRTSRRQEAARLRKEIKTNNHREKAKKGFKKSSPLKCRTGRDAVLMLLERVTTLRERRTKDERQTCAARASQRVFYRRTLAAKCESRE